MSDYIRLVTYEILRVLIIENQIKPDYENFENCIIIVKLFYNILNDENIWIHSIERVKLREKPE